MAAFPGVGLSSALLKLEWPCPNLGIVLQCGFCFSRSGVNENLHSNPLLVMLVILMLPVPGPLLEYHLLIKGGN